MNRVKQLKRLLVLLEQQEQQAFRDYLEQQQRYQKAQEQLNLLSGYVDDYRVCPKESPYFMADKKNRYLFNQQLQLAVGQQSHVLNQLEQGVAIAHTFWLDKKVTIKAVNTVLKAHEDRQLFISEKLLQDDLYVQAILNRN